MAFNGNYIYQFLGGKLKQQNWTVNRSNDNVMDYWTMWYDLSPLRPAVWAVWVDSSTAGTEWGKGVSGTLTGVGLGRSHWRTVFTRRKAASTLDNNAHLSLTKPWCLPHICKPEHLLPPRNTFATSRVQTTGTFQDTSSMSNLTH